MTLYARINPDTQQAEARDLAAPPKAGLGWLLLTIDAQPTPTASQVLVNGGVVIANGAAHQTWSVRAKTQAELDADTSAAEKTALQAALAVFDARTATNAQVQRAIAWLIRRVT